MAKASFLVLVVAIAGCLAAPEAAPRSEAVQSPAAAADPETGSLLITVTTPELLPVSEAQVDLVGTPHSRVTDAGGAARFDALEPGKYGVVAAKPGYEAANERGRLVDVLAGELTELRVILEPIEVATPDTTYHKSIPFTGFMSCSMYLLTGYSSWCGRGVHTPTGTHIGDPNDNTIHAWEVETVYVQTLLWEVKWTPSQGALGSELWSRLMAAWGCPSTAGQSCEPTDGFGSKNGKSPLLFRQDNGPEETLKKKFEKYGNKFPHKVYGELRAWCHSMLSGGSCASNVVINQRYDAWATAFYGTPAPPDFTALAN